MVQDAAKGTLRKATSSRVKPPTPTTKILPAKSIEMMQIFAGTTVKPTDMTGIAKKRVPEKSRSLRDLQLLYEATQVDANDTTGTKN